MDSKAFLAEMQAMVNSKHSKNHPLFDLIEDGALDRGQPIGFVKQFYQLFPKPFLKPISPLPRCLLSARRIRSLSRCGLRTCWRRPVAPRRAQRPTNSFTLISQTPWASLGQN